jgi:hypothetical protein
MAMYICKSYTVSSDHKIASKSYRTSFILKQDSKNLNISFMKYTILFLTLQTLLTFHLCAQPVIEEWVRRYPDTVNGWGAGNAITVDNKGYVYVTGTIVISNLMKYGTIKYSENGEVMWTRIYEGTNSGGRQPYAIAVDEKGNVFVTGYGYQPGNDFDYLTIKYDSLGNEKWVRFYDGVAHARDGAIAVITDRDCNIYVTGFVSLGDINWVYCTIKYDTEGNELWIRNFGIPNSGTRPYSMTMDNEANIYVTGKDSEKVATVCYDSSGNLKWSNKYPYVSTAYSIAVENNHNSFITGEILDSNGFNYLTIKYSAIGERLWIRKYSYTNQSICENQAHSVAVDNAGNIYVKGRSRENTHLNSICTIKYANNGDSIWVRRYYQKAIGNLNSISIDPYCNVYITSSASDSTLNNISTYLTLSYDSSGTLIWTKRYNENPNKGGSPQCIAIDNQGYVFISGLSSSVVIWNTMDMTTVKYTQPLYGIKKINEEVPINFILFQNYPNPFNPITKIKFSLPFLDKINTFDTRLIIYDVLGREVAVLLNAKLKYGTYEVQWNALKYSSGLYFYKLIYSNLTETKKMVLIK